MSVISKAASSNSIFQEPSVRWVWRNDLGLGPYKPRIVPLMTATEKLKKKKFANWLRTNLKKEDTLKISFSDEKIFDIDGVCNAQNNRM